MSIIRISIDDYIDSIIYELLSQYSINEGVDEVRETLIRIREAIKNKIKDLGYDIRNLSSEDIKRMCKVIVICALMVGGKHATTRNGHTHYKIDSQLSHENIKDSVNTFFLCEDFIDKVECVKKEMERIEKLNPSIKGKITISPMAIVYYATKDDFDIPLMIAQLRQESMFGTSNMAIKTNNPFSEGLWSDGTVRSTFKTQDESIPSYIKLMKDNYLVNGKTVDELLKDGGFVNKLGQRYASDNTYERKIRNIRNDIIRRYPSLAK